MSNPADILSEQGRDKQVDSRGSTEEEDLAIVSQSRVYDARISKLTDYKDVYEIDIYQQGYDKDATHKEIRAYPLYDHDEFVLDEDVQIHLTSSGYALILPFRTWFRQVVVYDQPDPTKPVVRVRDFLRFEEGNDNPFTGQTIFYAKSVTTISSVKVILVFNRRGGTDQKDPNGKKIIWEELPTIPSGGEKYDVLQKMDDLGNYGWDVFRLK
jgi:hypothetical protein